MKKEIRLSELVGLFVEAEVRYLSDPEAGTDGLVLRQPGVPRFSPTQLFAGLGKEIRGLGARDVHTYRVPGRKDVALVLRRERDRYLSLHVRENGHIRSLRTEEILSAEGFTLRIQALNRCLAAVGAAR